MPTRLSLLFTLAVVAGCSEVTSTQSGTSVLADRLATQKILWDVAQAEKVTYSFASPAPAELPIDFLIAWQIYHSDAELFRLRIESAKLELEMLARLVADPEYITAALRNAVAWEVDTQKDSFEGVEVARAKALNPLLIAEVKRASSTLTPAAQALKATIKQRFDSALAGQPDTVKQLTALRPASTALKGARANVAGMIGARKPAG